MAEESDEVGLPRRLPKGSQYLSKSGTSKTWTTVARGVLKWSTLGGTGKVHRRDSLEETGKLDFLEGGKVEREMDQNKRSNIKVINFNRILT